MIFQFILYLVVFYLLFRVIRFFIRYLNEPDSASGGRVKASKGDSKRIDREDIIEADFEEIDGEDEKKK